MRIDIDNQKTKKIIIYLVVRREKKGKKTKMIVGDNSITILRHAPLLVEENMAAHTRRR
jgi:hypothetical protein